ncbi:MAG TPA: hypothetical protein VN641_08480 [Urbifossiella sp.]|nr:hypothetical protein [Urbifossiella sp.]
MAKPVTFSTPPKVADAKPTLSPRSLALLAEAAEKRAERKANAKRRRDGKGGGS